MDKKLRRSKNQVVGGVCAGIANYLVWDITLVRALYALFTIFSIGTGVLIYIALWIIMPEEE